MSAPKLEIAFVPIAGVGGILGDLLLAAVAFGVILMIIFVGIWAAQWAQSALVGLPLIGPRAASLAGFLVTVQLNLAYRLEARVGASIYQTGYWLITTLREFTAPFFAPRDRRVADIWSVVVTTTHLAQFIWYNELPRMWTQIAETWDVVVSTTHLAQFIWYTELPRMWRQITETWDVVVSTTHLAQFIWYTELPRMWETIHGIDVLLRDLAQYRDLLRDLARFETATSGGVRALTRDLDFVRGRLGTAEGNIARVLPIAGVLVVSAEAVTNLRRVAKDPCHCLNDFDLSDYDDRLDALEIAVG